MFNSTRWLLNNKLTWLNNQWIKSRPAMFVIEPTNCCNLHCRMCPTHGANELELPLRTQGFMDVEAHADLVDRISKSIKRGIVICHGAGEPLLHPHFLRLIENIKKTGNLRECFLTNGTLLNETMQDELIALGVDEIGFSLNGADRHTYRQICGQDLYDKATSNILSFLDKLRTRCRQPIPTKMQIVETESTAPLIDEFIKIWLPLVDEIVVQRQRDATGRLIEGEIPAFQGVRPPCHRLIEPLTIAWNGDVHFCCEVWHGEKTFGNIFKNTLEKALAQQRTAIRLHRTFRANRIGVCSGCVAVHETQISFCKNNSYLEMISPLWRRIRKA